MALSTQAFSGHLQDKAVGLFTDNTTVTFYIYINKQQNGPWCLRFFNPFGTTGFVQWWTRSHGMQPPPGDICVGPPQLCLFLPSLF